MDKYTKTSEMTSLELPKWLKCTKNIQNTKNDQNEPKMMTITPKTFWMTKIP